MVIKNLLKSLFRSAPARKPVAHRHRFRPQLEGLDERIVPTTTYVWSPVGGDRLALCSAPGHHHHARKQHASHTAPSQLTHPAPVTQSYQRQAHK